MKVGNIIFEAAMHLGKLTLANEIKENLDVGKRLSEGAEAEVEKLLPCYNLTLSELSEERCPLLYKEALKPQHGRIYYSDFTKPPIEIKSVYRSVNAVKYDVYPTYLAVEGSEEVTVEYVYKYSAAHSINDDYSLNSKLITPRVIGEGIAAEYLLILGLYEEALMWRDRYMKSLSNCFFRKKVEKIKPRGWY